VPQPYEPLGIWLVDQWRHIGLNVKVETRQARATDPEERKRYLRAFEKRLRDEEAHYIYTLQNHRIIAHSSKVRGWTITPAHFLNQQLDTVWLAE